MRARSRSIGPARRRNRGSLLVPIAAACLLAPTSGRLARAEPVDAAALLPETCVVYAELRDPPALVATVLDHPLRGEIQATPQFVELRKNPEFQKLQIGLRLVEFKLQKLWRPAVEAATRGGIAIGVDPATEGVALLVRAEDKEILAQARDTLLEFARKDATEKGQDDPVQQMDYRGIDAYQFGKAGFAIHGRWLVVTNEAELGKAVLDRLLGDDVGTLDDRDNFQTARTEAGDATAWVWVDLAAVREMGLAKELFRRHAEDFGGELLVGGVLAALADAPYLTAARLHVDETGVRLSAAVPSDAATLAEQSEYFYGPNGRGAAPPPIEVARQIASVRAYRDASALWLLGPELFNEGVNAQMAKAESDLSTLAGGRSFGEDILGALGPEVQLVVANQDYAAADVPEPVIKLPGFAMVFTLRNPQESQRLLKIAYQQIVGFINLTAGQQGYPPLDLNTDQREDSLTVTASYLREDLERYAVENEVMGAARMQANFSPTAAFTGSYFVLSSTRELAREVVQSLQGTPPAAADRELQDVTLNTALHVAAPQLRAILESNREHLINQNMLQEGHSREAAEKEIDGLFTILGWLDRATLELSHTTDRVQLTVELRVRESK